MRFAGTEIWLATLKEIVNKLQLKENITEVSVEDLLAYNFQKGNLARAIILEDIEQLTDFGASPVLNLLKTMNAMRS